MEEDTPMIHAQIEEIFYSRLNEWKVNLGKLKQNELAFPDFKKFVVQELLQMEALVKETVDIFTTRAQHQQVKDLILMNLRSLAMLETIVEHWEDLLPESKAHKSVKKETPHVEPVGSQS